MWDARRTRRRAGEVSADAEETAAPAPAVETAAAMLEDERLGLARMAAARAGLALGLQQGVGNAAVARMLAREATKAAPARRALKGGKELDTMLLASSFFAPFVGPKMKNGIRAEGHVHLHDAEAFKTHALRYLQGRDNPKTGSLFTAEEAERFEPTLRGFQDDTGDVRIHERRADDGVVVHEAMHLFSSVAFVHAVGYSVNEGATEVFARRLAAENGITRAGFPQQHRLVARLVAVLGTGGEELLAGAYFNNDLKPLEDAVDRKKGAATWSTWLGLMQAGKVDELDALL
jgi:hypothetical protein